MSVGDVADPCRPSGRSSWSPPPDGGVRRACEFILNLGGGPAEGKFGGRNVSQAAPGPAWCRSTSSTGTSRPRRAPGRSTVYRPTPMIATAVGTAAFPLLVYGG